MRIQRSWILTLLGIAGAMAPAANLSAQTGPIAPQYGASAGPAAYGPPPPGYPPGAEYPLAMQGPGAYAPAGMMPPGMAPPGMAPPGMMHPGMMPPGMMHPGMYPPGMMPPGAMAQPAGYPGAMPGSEMMMPPGAPFPGMQAGYLGAGPGMPPELAMQQGMMHQGMPAGPMMQGPCNACGGAGCQGCGLLGHGLAGGPMHGTDVGDDHFRLHGLLRYLLPYGEGGCCSQRRFDIFAEAVFLKRENSGRFQGFTSDGPRGLGEPLIVLSTDNLNFDDPETGFRVRTALQLHPGGSLEFGYMGTFNWAASASATSDLNELFSVLSDYGSNPFLGFVDTDQSSFQGIEYSSTFDTVELDFRHRWVGPNCRLQGSWLAGVRYLKLDEEFRYLTLNTQDPPDGPGFMDYQVGTSNSMTGFQVGGDLWVCLIPGLRFGGEIKAGIFGNHAEQWTTIAAAELNEPLTEMLASDDVAFISEAELTVTWRLNYHWSIRGGYHFLFVDGVALGAENFNTTAPFVQGQGERVAFINDNGNVFYHGFTLGLEWMW
ncbi:MAG: BBP7 family outer membrane beta-barrel protein [Pirellulaceae bacterium]|nr:BBP7 family outer membrane beta-barrel protein [Pirellulaceae bacterium]